MVIWSFKGFSMSTDLWGAWVEVVAESGCAGGHGIWVVRWNVDGVAARQPESARRCSPLSWVWRRRRSFSLQESDSICQKITFWEMKWYNMLQHLHVFVNVTFSVTYSRVWGKLLGKFLHLCCVDVVVKVNKIALLLLTRSWIMCCWRVGGQDAHAVFSIICNQKCNK